MGVRDTHTEAYLTKPNGIKSRLRRNLLGESSKNFRSLLLEVLEKSRESFGSRMERRHVCGCNGTICHSDPAVSRTVFCGLTCEPRCHGKVGARGKVKSQPEWIEACFTTLKRRRSNLQFQVGVSFPYATSKVVGTPDIARVFADVYLAFRPVVEAALD